jgi:hypothetical protein
MLLKAAAQLPNMLRFKFSRIVRQRTGKHLIAVDAISNHLPLTAAAKPSRLSAANIRTVDREI